MKRYISLFEKKNWIPIKISNFLCLEEEVRIPDLMKHSGMSDFSNKFRKETGKIMGSTTKQYKLVQAKFNISKDYVTFIWLTERTKKFKDNFLSKVVDPNTFKLKNDTVYQIEIRVYDVFKYLKTSPDYPKVTNADIEYILMNNPIKLFDDTPSFHWQGGNFNLSVLGGSLHPTDIPPKHWDKYHGEGQVFLSKHSSRILASIKFFVPIMRQMIQGFLQKKKSK